MDMLKKCQLNNAHVMNHERSDNRRGRDTSHPKGCQYAHIETMGKRVVSGGSCSGLGGGVV